VGGIAIDISKHKQMDEQTRQRAEELQTLMDIVPVAIFIGHDPKCQNITGNQMANELYEAKIGENVSANVTHMRRLFHNGIELNVRELPMQKAAKGINVRNEEIDVLLPSGEWRSFMGSASPLHNAEGNVRGSVGAFVDITERKQIEEKVKNASNMLRLIMNNIPQGIFWKDCSSRYLGCNNVFAKAAGM
jgi:PAS domain-containing protein